MQISILTDNITTPKKWSNKTRTRTYVHCRIWCLVGSITPFAVDSKGPSMHCSPLKVYVDYKLCDLFISFLNSFTKPCDFGMPKSCIPLPSCSTCVATQYYGNHSQNVDRFQPSLPYNIANQIRCRSFPCPKMCTYESQATFKIQNV